MDEGCCCGQRDQLMELCDCAMCGSAGYQRRFMTKAEKVERLKEYEAELRKELEGVGERIDELRKE